MSIGRRASRVANSLHICEFNRFEAVVRPRPQMARHVVRGRHLAAPWIAGLGRAAAVCIADLGGESGQVSCLRFAGNTLQPSNDARRASIGCGRRDGGELRQSAEAGPVPARLVQPHLRGAVATAHLRWEVSLERVADGATDGARAADAAK